jgi:hypothetical protein
MGLVAVVVVRLFEGLFDARHPALLGLEWLALIFLVLCYLSYRRLRRSRPGPGVWIQEEPVTAQELMAGLADGGIGILVTRPVWACAVQRRDQPKSARSTVANATGVD